MQVLHSLLEHSEILPSLPYYCSRICTLLQQTGYEFSITGASRKQCQKN